MNAINLNRDLTKPVHTVGLKAIGHAHFGAGHYAAGTNSEGSGLLYELDRLNIILDTTHLTDQSFFEATELFHAKGRHPIKTATVWLLGKDNLAMTS
jgi:microsomal dipeptidase-like Zn-dependent dipeptidase